MNSLQLFLAASAASSFIVQSVLCCKMKNRILRHGALILPIIFIIFGIITLMTQYGHVFSGLGAIAAVLWLVAACCAALGYGAAWAVIFVVKNGRTKKWKGKKGFSINMQNHNAERRDSK